MPKPLVELYFDFISPYAYLGWRSVRALQRRLGFEIEPHPVLYAGLLNHWHLVGPAEVPAKRDYMFRDCLRVASLGGFEFEGPPHHPFKPLLPLRMTLAPGVGSRRSDLVDALFLAIWGEGLDPTSPSALAAVADRAGFDGRALVEGAGQPEVKRALRTSTEKAVSRGVFGVPTARFREQIYWGNDRVGHLELALSGRDPLDAAKLERILARPRGAERR